MSRTQACSNHRVGAGNTLPRERTVFTQQLSCLPDAVFTLLYSTPLLGLLLPNWGMFLL